MRRKSERTATKKTKSSPEKKVEKVKRTRSSRRKKQSTSSEESGDEGNQSPIHDQEPASTEAESQGTPVVKDDSPEDGQEQVWQVKSAKPSGDTGEIQKLKICLTRPPSTPERVDRSPRSKRKHSRATSSSDTPCAEGGEDKKRRSHKSKKASRDLKEELEKGGDSIDEHEKDKIESSEELAITLSQSSESRAESVPEQSIVSTTEEEKNMQISSGINENCDEAPADTTTSPKHSQDTGAVEPEVNKSDATVTEEREEIVTDAKSPAVTDKGSSEPEPDKPVSTSQVGQEDQQVSKVEETNIPCEGAASPSEAAKAINDHDVLELDCNEIEGGRKMSTESHKEDEPMKTPPRRLERSESTHSTHNDTLPNGGTTPIVINRKRRWGSRPSTVRKTITISTDLLKDIIPDVKPAEFEEVIEVKKPPKQRLEHVKERLERPVLPKIIIDNSENYDRNRDGDEKEKNISENVPVSNRKISIVKENDIVLERAPSPPRQRQSCILYITNLVRPFTLPQLKNLLQRTGRIADNGFWIDKIKSKCYVKYETEDQAVETRHALHGVTWPVSNPKTLQVDFSTDEAFEKAQIHEDEVNAQASAIPGTVEDWLLEQDMKRERGEQEKPWEKKIVREWDMGKGDKAKEGQRRDERNLDKRRHHSQEKSPEPAKKFKKKEEELPAKLLDDLFRKTKATPCIYWLPLSPETIAIKEEQRRQHMAEHERRLNELRRHRRH